MATGLQASRERRGRARIGTRLGLVLVVPLLGLVALTAVQATAAARQYRDATELRSRAEVAVAAQRLVDALQDERTRLAGDQVTTPQLRGRVEAAATGLARLRDRTTGEDRELLDRALDRTRAAAALAANGSGGIVAVEGYSPAVAALVALTERSLSPGGAVDDAPAATAGLLASAQEAASRERGLLTALAGGRTLSPAQFQQATELAAAQQVLAERAAAVADPSLAPDVESLVRQLRAADDTRQQLFFDQPSGRQLGPWLDGSDTRVARLSDLRDRATATALAAVDALAAAASRTLLLAGLVLVATILVSLLLVRGATRSIARPLAELAARAEEVALSRLPDAVRAQQRGEPEVHLPRLRAGGAAEVRDVAAAFNDVQDTALRLASEQALLRRHQADALTNLGRRNQALLGRQLDYISELEQRETDPAFLEHLFRLDHLASRMRRNAESLLILAGSETPRRRRTPAEVAEVVRAAMSEVEDFERVRLGQLGTATVAGPVVIDLVHLVAELVENALNFSPPSTTVEVDGRGLGQGGYQLAVIDHGVGMTDVELQAANQRMGGLDGSDGMPTRYLGQYVVARLAAKTGAMVRLQPTVGGRGVTAVVTLPPAAMAGGPDRADVARPLPGTRAALEQGPAPFAPGAGLVPAQPEAVVDPAADPYAEPVPVLAGPVPAVPPPGPADAPEQDWAPVPAAGAAPSVTAMAPEGTAPAPEGTAPAPGGTAPPAPGGTARLARRVPGASLAHGPLAPDEGPGAAPTQRSAEGVRTMLAALQTGRARGRTDGGAEPQPGREAPGWEESR